MNEPSPSFKPVTNQGFKLDCEIKVASVEKFLLFKFNCLEMDFELIISFETH